MSIFTEISHADRCTTTMKLIKREFRSKAYVLAPWWTKGWDQKFKIQLFKNTVMLHIKLKGTTKAAAWYRIFCPKTPTHPIPLTLGLESKRQNSTFFQNMVMLHIKLKGNAKCSNMVANILPTDIPLPPQP